jgi:hypothetical protein
LAFVVIIDILVLAGILYLAAKKGIESALPFFVFVVVCTPEESTIPLPFVSLTTRRVAMCALLLAFLFFKNKKESPLEKTPFKYLLILYAGWCVLSTANSIVFSMSLKQMISQVIEYYILYYILTRAVTSVETVHKIIGAMVFGVFVSCVAGAFEPYTDWRVTQWFPSLDHHFTMSESDGRGWRIQATFGNYSLMGSAVAFALIEVFYLLTITKSGLKKVYFWVAIILMFLNIYKTTSRGPWLAFMVGFAILGVTVPRTRKYLTVICVMTILAFIIRPGVWQTVVDIYKGSIVTDPNSELASSYQYRYALWGVGEKVLARSFSRQMWGYGMESFYDLHIVAPFNTNPAYPFESCDSSWAQAMVETGYVGLFLIGVLLVVPALTTLKNCLKLPKPDNALCWVLLINMLQYYFMMTNVALYGWGQTGFMLWTWIALSVSYAELVRKAAVPIPVKSPAHQGLNFATT